MQHHSADWLLDTTVTGSQTSNIPQSSVLPTISPTPSPVPVRFSASPYNRVVAAGWYRPAARRQVKRVFNPSNSSQPPPRRATRRADHCIEIPNTPKAENDTAPAAPSTFTLIAGWYRPHVAFFKTVRRDPYVFGIHGSLFQHPRTLC